MEEFKRRVDRNKDLYKKVDQEIENIAKQESNAEFNKTNKTLSTINSEFFGSSSTSPQIEEKKDNSFKKYLITGVVFAVIVVLIIIGAVVISHGN